MGSVTRNGKVIQYDDSTTTSWWWEKWYVHGWEEALSQAMGTYCKPDKTAVDIGAWNGVHTLYLAQLCRRVVSVEPDPIAQSDLMMNLWKNGTDNVVVVPNALFSRNEVCTLGNAVGNSSSSLLPTHQGNINIPVKCITVAQLVRLAGIDPADTCFVKVDIEGAEQFIVPDLVELLHKAEVVLNVSFHPKAVADDVIGRLVDLLNSRMTSIGTELWKGNR